MPNKTLCKACLFDDICPDNAKELMADRGDCQSFKMMKSVSYSELNCLLD